MRLPSWRSRAGQRATAEDHELRVLVAVECTDASAWDLDWTYAAAAGVPTDKLHFLRDAIKVSASERGQGHDMTRWQ
jgi:hypothetical protein